MGRRRLAGQLRGTWQGNPASNVGTGYDVSDGVYPGWCIQDFVVGLLNNDPVMLYSTYDPNMPADVQSLPWNEINYVLNHKQGGISDVQIAIWFLVGDPVPSSLGPVTPAAQAMIDAANANPTYEPGTGDIVAVIVYSDGMGTDPNTKQETIIEVKLNPTAVSLASFTGKTSDVNSNLAGLAIVLLAAAGLLFSRRMLAVRLSNN